MEEAKIFLFIVSYLITIIWIIGLIMFVCNIDIANKIQASEAGMLLFVKSMLYLFLIISTLLGLILVIQTVLYIFA